MRNPASLAPIALALVVTACGEPADRDAAAPDAPPPLGPAEPADLGPDETWRQRVAGRWSQEPGCGGMTWNFQAGTFTTPGETHCRELKVTDGPGDSLRAEGSFCLAEGERQDDILLEVRLGDGTIDVLGVGNPIATPGWFRCE